MPYAASLTRGRVTGPPPLPAGGCILVGRIRPRRGPVGGRLPLVAAREGSLGVPPGAMLPVLARRALAYITPRLDRRSRSRARRGPGALSRGHRRQRAALARLPAPNPARGPRDTQRPRRAEEQPRAPAPPLPPAQRQG